MKALNRKILRDLGTLQAQVITLASLIICGVAVLTSSWSSYQTLKKARDLYYSEYNFADVFVDFKRAPANIISKLRNLPEVKSVEGRIVEEGLVDVSGQAEPALGRFVSWSPEGAINRIFLREGHFPAPGSVQDVLVHESFAKTHGLHTGDSLNVLLKGNRAHLRISGIGISPEFVYAISPLSPFPDEKHFGVFWMSREGLEKLVQMQGAINNIVVLAKGQEHVSFLKMRLDQILSSYASSGAYDRSSQISNVFIEDEIEEQRSMAGVIPGIFIAIGAFIVHVVMSRLIALHRGPISILKALGYSSWELSLHYWKLVTFILMIGFVPALMFSHGIGLWYAVLYERYFRFPQINFSLTWEALLIGLAAAFLPGWLASMNSLQRVFRMMPAEGMRPPSPPSFHKGPLGKLQMIKSWGGAPKMIFRDLLFSPLRTLLSILGISAATAVLINGSFWMDIVDFILDRQFYQSSREDLEVRFMEPKSPTVLREITQIPGVFHAEGVRAVPARMRFRNFSKDTILLTLTGDSQMRRVLSSSGGELRPADSGIIMSEYFRRKYGIRVGDILEFEVLQGARPVIDVVVGGFADDLVGATGYISAQFLQTLLHENPAIDAAYVRLDPAKAQSVYIKLKESPSVAAVSIRKLTLQSFSQTIGGMIRTFTMILIVFAVTIAGGVMFNMSRIALSEKSWEFASLRIMGFDVGFVFNLLFAQLGLQVFFAILPGMALGYILAWVSTKVIHSEAFSFPLVIYPQTYALAVVVILMTYFLGGYFLFRKVIKLNFTDALKARE